MCLHLPDEVGFGEFFLDLRRAEVLDAELEGLYHECHVESHLTGGLHTFLVLGYFARGGTVSDGPVLGWDYGHVGLEEILVEGVHSGGGSTSACYADGCAYLHGPVLVETGVEEAVEEGKECSIGRGKIYWRADEDALGCVHLVGYVVGEVAKGTFVRVPTSVAGDATVDGTIAYMYPFGLDAFLIENSFCFVKHGGCITIVFWTAIEN